MNTYRGYNTSIPYPMRYDGPTKVMADLGRLATTLQHFMSGHQGVTHVMQIEYVDRVLLLTERVLSDDRRMVLGISRTLASTRSTYEHGVTHGELHTFMRAFMLVQPYMLDFGPNHCDNDCPDHWADDKWYGNEYTDAWRRKLGLSCPV